MGTPLVIGEIPTPIGDNGRMARKVSPEYKKEVGERMRLTREAIGLGQAELAQLIGEEANTWNQYENGKRLIDPITLQVWTRRHGVDANWVYHGDSARLPHEIAVKVTAAITGEDPRTPSSARRAKQKAAK